MRRAKMGNLEIEASGAVSAGVPGLPVYAAADTPAKAERAIRAVLTAYPISRSTTAGSRVVWKPGFPFGHETTPEVVGLRC